PTAPPTISSLSLPDLFRSSSLYTNPGSVTSNLVGYWALTNASSVPDFSGQGNAGTNNGATVNASAPTVTALNDGTANPITLTARDRKSTRPNSSHVASSYA